MQLPGKRECCWTATADATSYAKLKHSGSTDVAIVGAGIVGLTAAYLLTRAGLSVTVLEARQDRTPGNRPLDRQSDRPTHADLSAFDRYLSASIARSCTRTPIEAASSRYGVGSTSLASIAISSRRMPSFIPAVRPVVLKLKERRKRHVKLALRLMSSKRHRCPLRPSARYAFAIRLNSIPCNTSSDLRRPSKQRVDEFLRIPAYQRSIRAVAGE